MAERDRFDERASELGDLEPDDQLDKDEYFKRILEEKRSQLESQKTQAEEYPGLEFEEATDEDVKEVEEWLDEESQPEPTEEESASKPAETPKSPEKPDPTKRMAIKVNNKPVAFFQLKKHGNIGHLFLALAPHMRGRGLGRPFLAKAERHAQAVEVHEFRIWVHINNKAGQKVLRASGYEPVRKKGEFIEFKKRIVEPHVPLI
ncbi:MAG TPA: GNAT family N-acetyltransferase [Candidatus Saccharimonadales bacterium]|nr:GNAT family N-acetyltransferase [Candidatus Saccharimonadales bacterium]